MILGSACEQGELISAILRYASDGELAHVAGFYDYLEVQPDGNNAFLIREGRFQNMEGVRDITRRVVRLGEMLGKPVAATCDVHFIEPSTNTSAAYSCTGKSLPMRTTSRLCIYVRLLKCSKNLSYLGADKAREIVIDNTRAIAAQIEQIEAAAG